MQFDVEIVLRETNQAVTARLEHGTDPASWREPDVEIVLKQILLAIDRTKNPGEAVFSFRALPDSRNLGDQMHRAPCLRH